MNGFGERFDSNDAYFIGEFNNNMRHGKGKEIIKEFIYEGNFVEDKKEGVGKIKYIRIPDFYEGEFHNNSITGFGEYTWANKDVYKGPMINGKMHGIGSYKWPDGTEYNGNYINNIKQGMGKFKWANGRVFEGPFKNGKPDGIGRLNISNRMSFKVEFRNGKLTKNFDKNEVNSKHPSKSSLNS